MGVADSRFFCGLRGRGAPPPRRWTTTCSTTGRRCAPKGAADGVRRDRRRGLPAPRAPGRRVLASRPMGTAMGAFLLLWPRRVRVRALLSGKPARAHATPGPWPHPKSISTLGFDDYRHPRATGGRAPPGSSPAPELSGTRASARPLFPFLLFGRELRKPAHLPELRKSPPEGPACYRGSIFDRRAENIDHGNVLAGRS